MRPANRLLRLPVFLLAVSLLSAGRIGAQEPPAARAGGAQTNAAGQVVLDTQGDRIVYAEGDALVAAPQSAPATAADFAVEAAPGETFTLALDQVWSAEIWGTSIGRSGMVPVDLDADGKLEIVLTGSVQGGFYANSVWRIVRFNPATREYDLVWSSPVYTAGVTRVSVHAIAGKPKVFVGLGDGRLLRYDGATRTLEREAQVTNRPLRAILLADADNDGALEVVVATESSLHLLDPASLAQESSIPQGAWEIAVGNVDADPRLEIVLASGPVIEFDGAVATVQWSFAPFGVGAYLVLTDLDGDGMQEIVSARSWYYIDVFDADLQSPKYQVRTGLDIHALLLADVTGDGRDEILYGDAQWGQIHALDAQTGSQIWQIPNPEHGTTRIAVADVDADGALEVMWGAGFTSTGPDYLFVHGLPSRALEWKSMDLVGPFAAVARGDVDDDGGDEIVAISWGSNSGYADGVVHVFDAETYALEWRSSTNLFSGTAWTGVRDVAIGDVDRDGSAEIVVGTDRLYDGRVYVIGGKSHVIERIIQLDSGSPINALALADLDGDGAVEIVAGASLAHSGSPGIYVYAIDGATGAVLWRTVSLSSSSSVVFALEVADLSGDGKPEIVATVDQLVVIDGAQRTLRKSASSGLRGFDLADADGDGRPEIWAGTTSGDLVTFDPATLERRVEARICTGVVNSVRLERAASLKGSVQFACENELGVYGLFEKAVLWRSTPLTYAGRANNLQVADRGEQALLVAGTGSAVVAFQGWGTSNTDVDGDGVLNHRDNCPEQPNPAQADADADGVGDACNDALDADGDEWADGRDNCPGLANAGQADADANGLGDACNEVEDGDGDEWADLLDNCPEGANGDQANRDGDPLGDLCDRYPDNPDNYAARCDEAVVNETLLGQMLQQCVALPKFEDADADGEADATDACPETPAASSADAAGCSGDQFCAQFSGVGVRQAILCIANDWRNDEPLASRPGDCELGSLRFTGGRFSFDCVAR